MSKPRPRFEIGEWIRIVPASPREYPASGTITLTSVVPFTGEIPQPPAEWLTILLKGALGTS